MAKIEALKTFNFGDAGDSRKLEPGMVVDVPDPIAEQWFKLGWARKYQEPKK